MKISIQNLLTVAVLLLFSTTNLLAQNWIDEGFTPGEVRAYDQNGNTLTVATTNNLYRSTDGGNTWQQKLSAANFPVLQEQFINTPSNIKGKFQFLLGKRSHIYGDVIFLTANMGPAFSSSSWIMFNSTDGGNTWTQIFADDDPFDSNAAFGYDSEVHQIDANTYLIRFIKNTGTSNVASKFYISTNSGQSWNLYYESPDRFQRYAGRDGSDLAFYGITSDQLTYRDRNSGAITRTLTLPESVRAAQVVGNRIRTMSWTSGNNQLRSHQSTNGGSSFQLFTDTRSEPPFEAQFLGDLAYVRFGRFSSFTDTYRYNYGNFSSPVDVIDAGFPLRLNTDGTQSSTYGDFFRSPPVQLSTNNWTTATDVDRPPYSFAAMPLLDGNYFRFIRDKGSITTDGVNFQETFDMVVSPFEIKFFEEAVYANGYSDPQTYHYLTNDGVNANFPPTNVVEAGGALYYYVGFGSQQGVFRSDDNGDTWVLDNPGYFWRSNGLGDDVSGSIYSFDQEFIPGNPNDPLFADRYRLLVSRSDDQGRSWSLLNGANFPSVSQENYVYNQFSPIVIHNDYFFIKGDTELRFSTDGGASFQIANNLPFEVAGAQMWQRKGSLYFKTKSENVYRVNINDWLGANGGGRLTGGQVDLELSVSINPPDPNVYNTFEVTYTIENKGNIPATNVSIRSAVGPGQGVVEQGGTVPTFTGDVTGTCCNTIPPGGSGTITYYYFRLDGDPVFAWGEIRSQEEPDVDSRPRNGDCCATVNEDDEASTQISTPGPCSPDLDPPVFSGCPADIVLNITGTSTVVNWTPPTVTDACSSVSLSSNRQPGSTFNLGTTTVRYFASDASLNRSDCSFTVTINQSSNPCSPDVTPPVVSNCPSNINLSTDGSSRTASWTPPTANDACSATTVSATHQPGSSFPIGSTTVRYTFSDASGNSSACEFVVTITQSGGGGCTNNLLTNSGFESGFQGWDNRTNSGTIVSDAFAGSSAVKVCPGGESRVIQAVRVTGGETYTLEFAGKNSLGGINFTGSVFVKFLTGSFQPLPVNSVISVPGDWRVIDSEFTAPANAVYAEINLQAPFGGSNCIFIDEVCFSESGGTNPTPEPDLQLSNFSAPATATTGSVINYSFDLSNTGQADAAAAFSIKAYFSTDNTISSDDIQDGTIPTGNLGAGQTVTGVAGASTVPAGLSSGDYYLLLKVDADNSIAESNENNNVVSQAIFISGGTNPPQPGCTASSDFPWHDWIAGVKIGSVLDKTSSKSMFSDFTNPAIPLEAGSSYPVTLTTGYSYVTYDEYWRIWIDTDRDGSYESNEIVYQGMMSRPSNGTSSKSISGTLTLPAGASPGSAGMRVIMTRDGYADPCGTVDFGEVEDYQVNILDAGNAFSFQRPRAQFDQVTVYPNPAGDYLTVDLADRAGQVDELRIIDALGRTIHYRQLAEDRMIEQRIEIDLSQVKNGSYILQLNGKDLPPISRKVSVQRTY